MKVLKSIVILKVLSIGLFAQTQNQRAVSYIESLYGEGAQLHTYGGEHSSVLALNESGAEGIITVVTSNPVLASGNYVYRGRTVNSLPAGCEKNDFWSRNTLSIYDCPDGNTIAHLEYSSNLEEPYIIVSDIQRLGNHGFATGFLDSEGTFISDPMVFE